jgi:adenylylsulfate kinase
MKIFWLTGLSGAGKTTIARKVKGVLEQEGKKVLLIDGDEIRAQYPRALGFSREDIIQNNRFIADLCKKRIAEFDYIFVSVITPFGEIRRELKDIFGEQYVEVYVKATLEEVIRRDVKGLYKKALAGEIRNFIGVDKENPYEPPGNPDLVIETGEQSEEASLAQLIHFIADNRKGVKHGKFC